MTTLQAIREFVEEVTEFRPVLAKERSDWGCEFAGQDSLRLTLPKVLTETTPNGKIFIDNFVERCPIAQEYSEVTLTLLHECGHWMTRDVMYEIGYKKMADAAEDQVAYMKIPFEMLATDWAICWLLHPYNQQVAKDFEKKFFKRG